MPSFLCILNGIRLISGFLLISPSRCGFVSLINNINSNNDIFITHNRKNSKRNLSFSIQIYGHLDDLFITTLLIFIPFFAFIFLRLFFFFYCYSIYDDAWNTLIYMSWIVVEKIGWWELEFVNCGNLLISKMKIWLVWIWFLSMRRF